MLSTTSLRETLKAYVADLLILPITMASCSKQSVADIINHISKLPVITLIKYNEGLWKIAVAINIVYNGPIIK